MHHMKDVMLEPNPKMEFGESIQKMEGLSKYWDGRCSPSKCCQTNTNLVLDPRQAPEHSKSSSILRNITQVLFMFDALGYKSWLEPLDAYNFFVQKYTFNPM